MASATILDAGYRDDLGGAHAAIIEGLAKPGAWWTANERTAIAAEVRRAVDHADLPPWQAPSSEGLVAADHVLPSAAVDVTWRLTNHPGTLTQDWYDGIIGEFPSPQHYVELVAIVAAMNSIDRFATIMDLAPIPLGEALTGEPSHAEPDDVAVTTHWVPTTPGPGAGVMRALSVAVVDVPRRQRLSEAQYVPDHAVVGDLEWSRDTMDRRQVELIAAATSMVNECFY